MATKSPSEWLRLLCRDWSQENEHILSSMDERFLGYKSYLKGRLTSQLLCRLSLSGRDAGLSQADPSAIDFWKILGVQDEFDRAHIVANVERFCSLYNIRGGIVDESAADVVYGNTHILVDQGMPVEGAVAVASGLGGQMMYNLDPNGMIAKNAKAQQSVIKSEMRRIKAENRERDREGETKAFLLPIHVSFL
jgi:hypothetical protein